MNKKELVEKINSLDALTIEEKSALIDLLKQKKYGLVWENKPEDVEERLRAELPVLKEVTDKALLDGGEDAPNHILIEGDNLEALTALAYTHENSVDVIYIDPPYNTGNKDFVYNDSFVDAEDGYRHSKWLSFMDKRLRIAKRLLSDRGVIFISIDDNEQANLKLLCDEVLGERNFIAQLIWSAGRKNDSKHISVSHEYVLVYVNSKDYIVSNKIIWRERKQGLDDIYKQETILRKKYGSDYDAMTEGLRSWYKSLANGHPAKDHSHYNRIDEKGIFFASDISWPGGGGPKYELLHPITGLPVTIPSRGFITKKETMEQWVEQGKVYFGKDETSVPCLKSYLKDREKSVPYSVFYQDGRAATKRLMSLFGGKKVFDNPKDDEIIKRLLSFTSLTNSTILDFFAGSGTTLHATMQLNAEDGGHRKCILVTNNENNICEEVTYERNKRVINGYTTPKGEEVEGLKANNLRYYQIDHVERESSLTAKRKLMAASAELLCIKHDIYEESTTFGTLKLKPHIARYFTDGKKQMLVVYMVEAIERIVEEIQAMPEDTNIMVYVFSTNNYAMDADFEDVADKVTLCALPAAIYNAYLKVLPKKGEPKQIIEEEF